MMILSLVRNYLPSHDWVLKGGWNIADCAARSYDIEGMHVGTVAAGRIGSAMSALTPAQVVAFVLAVLISFLFMKYMGISSNLMSLAGIAIAIGVLYLKNMNPGPTLFVENPQNIYAVFIIFFLANLLLLPLGWLLIKAARNVLHVPRNVLMPVILLFCVVGAFAINNAVFDVGVMLAFAGRISDFVHRHPTVKMLALSFLILIGVMLVIVAKGATFGSGGQPWPFGVQEALMGLLALVAYNSTAAKIRKANRFTWAPIVEHLPPVLSVEVQTIP